MSNLLPTPDQRGIVEAVGGPIAEILPVARLHAADDGAWLIALADLGALGIALGEDAGGAGLSVVEEALLFERLGRQLASPSVLATVLAAHMAAARGEATDTIVGGTRRVALAVARGSGDALLIDAPAAPDAVLLLGPDKVALLGADALADRRLLDGGQWALPIETARVAGSGDASLVARARLLIAAHLVGIAAAARDMAVEYAKIREQFGRPIGSFQATKHHCADMAIGALAAADQLAFAAVALADGRADADFQLLSALSVAIRIARRNAAINIQIHGGMGFSDECDAHLFVKHAHVWETIAGGGGAIDAALFAMPSPFGRA